MNDYQNFLEKKKINFTPSGFDIDQDQLNPMLFPFQKFCVQRALKAGKYALFEDCGLGKTFQQIEWAHQVALKEFAPVLILCPLAVSAQTIKEGAKLGIEVLRYDGNPIGPQIYISNYEQLENIDCSKFAGVVLDESSILKAFDGKMRNLIINNFQETKYKLCCTATPSPNDPMEIGNHSEFLQVMKYQEMLAMFFVHDASDTSKWRLKGHAQSPFFKWMASWAVMLANPADIGFVTEGYNLPELAINEIEVKTEKRDNGQLFNDTAVSATNHNAELRATMDARMTVVANLVNSTTEPFIVWVKQNEEEDAILKLIPDAVAVRGNEPTSRKESKLLGFANGDFRVLVTKTKIAKFGLNYQHCRNQVFASPDFSFEGFYQGVRRSYRFGQTQNVNIHVVVTDTMENVTQSIRRKQSQFLDMQNKMAAAFTLSIDEEIKGKKQYNVEKFETPEITAIQGDCVQLIADIPSKSIPFSVFSPPFADLYTYSDELEDMGNCTDYDQFCVQFGYLVKELGRVMMDGRNVAVHCMDLPIQKGKEGYIGLRDFSGMILRLFAENGFIYHSRVTIWKNPVTEMQRTHALGLLHAQIKKDSSMSRTGIPDYVLVFRKEGVNTIPITHYGDINDVHAACKKDPSLNFEIEKSKILSVDKWQKYASPVWMDIDYGNTLNKIPARDDNDEKHICPLQLDTIERCIALWSNPNEVVFTPFGGIGSEPYQAIKMGRKGLAFELKPSYFQLLKQNCQQAINEVAATKMQLSLF